MPINEAVDAIRTALAGIATDAVAFADRGYARAGQQPSYSVTKAGARDARRGRVELVAVNIHLPATMEFISEQQIDMTYARGIAFLDWVKSDDHIADMHIYWTTGVDSEFIVDEKSVDWDIVIPLFVKLPVV